jgi:hypothetical protein
MKSMIFFKKRNNILLLLAQFIIGLSFSACQYFECIHDCGTPLITHPISHTFTPPIGNTTWVLDSKFDFLTKSRTYKLTVLNQIQWQDKESNNFFIYDATIPEYETSVYRYSIDSITKLMQHEDSINLLSPKKNKQLLMKYFYMMMDVEPLDSSQFLSLIDGILYRKNDLEKNNPNKWKQRIEDLKTLHNDIKDLFKGCSKFEYPNGFDNEKDSVAYLYFDKLHSTFIKLTFTKDSTKQFLFRPLNFHLLTDNEAIKEQCSCCDIF